MQLFIVISCWLSLIGCFTFGEEVFLREKWKSRIKDGLADGKHLVDVFSTEPRSKVFNQINLMTNFIGTVDSLASFIQDFNPKTEQEMFKELKKTFTGINRKLELTTDRGFGRDLRDIYFELRNIEFSFLILNRFLEKLEELKCTSQDECKAGLQWTIKLFKNDFDVVGYYRHIFQATLNGTRFSKMSLLQQVKETSGCNDKTILKFGTNLLLKLFKAEQIMVVYGKLAEMNTISISQIRSWTQDMYEFRRALLRVVQECSSKKVCKAKCQNGKCVHLTSENRDICCCPQYYDGTNCQIHNQVILAMDIVAVMSTLKQVPKAGDIIDLKLATNLLIASMKCISFAYETIQKVNTKAIQTHVLTTSDLGSFYNTYLSMNYLIKSARSIMKCDKIVTHEYKKAKLSRIAFHLQKALYKIDSYFNYRRDEDTFQPESLLTRVINLNKNEACTSDFKTKINNLLRQFHIAQANGLSVLLQVRHVLNTYSPKVLNLFEQHVKEQIQSSMESTCSAEITYSTNVHCDQFHLVKNIDIENRCMKGYTRNGTRYLRCQNITSDCLACNCNKTGSVSTICNSETGQCQCRNNFLGKNCDIEIKHDCKWSDWGSWSGCSKSCGIGVEEKRSRHIVEEQKGQGRQCDGKKDEKRNCFRRCCDGTFQCKDSSKCLIGMKCQPCKCDHRGSISGRCQPINGACSCKLKYSGRRCQDDNIYKDCTEISKKSIQKKSGVYQIYPLGLDRKSVSAYCDMTTDGGGWTVIQRRFDGSVNFQRTWVECENGFGDVNGELWLGNTHVHRLTTTGNYEIRIELVKENGKNTYAVYNKFMVGDAKSKYKLTVSGYSGNAGNANNDNFGYHNGKVFSTFNQDNDSYPSNCAIRYGGPWWYYKCYGSCNLNRLYSTKMVWNARNEIKKSVMMIREL